MTRTEAVALIHQQLGFRADQSANIITNLIVAQTMLEAGPTKPWFLVSEDSYTSTVADEQRLEVPTDFLQEVEEAVLRYVPTDTEEAEVDLVKEDYDQLRKDYADVDPGAPEAYALVGNYFYLFPLPDDEYAIRMIYMQKDTSLSSDVENGWLKHVPFLLVGKAGGMMAAALRDAGAMAQFARWEQEGRLTLTGQNESRKHANRSYQMGGPH